MRADYEKQGNFVDHQNNDDDSNYSGSYGDDSGDESGSGSNASNLDE